MSDAIHVKKYGGTSVANLARIRQVADELVQSHRSGTRLVIVVSAMDRTTDDLKDLALQLNARPGPRELDMLMTTGEQVSSALLAIAIQAKGIQAVSLTGAQCGILTDGAFSRAKIRGINTDRIRRHLEAGEMVVVTGFQGVTTEQEITTLGRGGSDTTAAALAAALDAQICEIITDVKGVYSADPRIEPSARLLSHITYDEMLEYAASGSRVLHPRCVEIVRRFGVPLRVRSGFEAGSGTLITEGDGMEDFAVTGVTGDDSIARINLHRVADQPGTAALLMEPLAAEGINVQLVVQGPREGGQAQDMALVVSREDADRALELLEEKRERLAIEAVTVDRDIARVSIIGSGIGATPGVAASMFGALGDQHINILLISSSEFRITCVIAGRENLEKAICAIHREFELGKAPESDEIGRRKAL